MNLSLSLTEIRRRKQMYYMSMALNMGLENPEDLVKKITRRSTPNSKHIHQELKKALTRQKNLKSFHTSQLVKKTRVQVLKRPVVTLPWNKRVVVTSIGLVTCESNTSIRCLKKFISSGEKVCIRCRTQNTPN